MEYPSHRFQLSLRLSVGQVYPRDCQESHPGIREINMEGESISEDGKADLILITNYSRCSILFTVSSSPLHFEVLLM